MKKNNSPKFDDVQNVCLRTWNRCAIVFNLRADAGEEEARNYVAQFDEVGKKQIFAMFDYIALKGYSNVRREVTNGEMDKRLVQQ
ncbi:hypothetical protein D3C81_1039240 [compost metagenome]